tara:strand:+ start:1218 stop:1529 length:312 start_codon:yes stop_codon:yes gene_type:complete
MNKGFHIKFDNGLTLSVQFGRGNYCDNRDYSRLDMPFCDDDYDPCRNAEIAVFDREGDLVPISERDDVAGYVDINHVLDFIDVVRKLPSSVNRGNWREFVAAV